MEPVEELCDSCRLAKLADGLIRPADPLAAAEAADVAALDAATGGGTSPASMAAMASLSCAMRVTVSSRWPFFLRRDTRASSALRFKRFCLRSAAVSVTSLRDLRPMLFFEDAEAAGAGATTLFPSSSCSSASDAEFDPECKGNGGARSNIECVLCALRFRPLVDADAEAGVDVPDVDRMGRRMPCMLPVDAYCAEPRVMARRVEGMADMDNRGDSALCGEGSVKGGVMLFGLDESSDDWTTRDECVGVDPGEW